MLESQDQILEENRRLRRAVEELTTINDLARAITARRESQEIMDIIIRRSLKAVNAEQGVITLVVHQQRQTMKTLVRATVSSGMHEQFHMNQNLLGWMHINKKPLLIENPQSDSRFRGIKWDPSIRSLLCVPLLVKSEVVGALTVYNKKEGDRFTIGDQRLLAIIAAQSAQVVENARLYEEEKKYFLMQDEVKVASEIQTGLLPKEAPEIPGYDMAGISIPARQVGGDYFDFIRIDESHLAISLGDVTGKGMPAALLMANLQATVRGQAMIGDSPAESLRRANKLLVQNIDINKFVTLFYGVLDISKHELHYSNAGHDHPYLFSNSGHSFSRLEAGGIVLGFMADSEYVETRIGIEPGGCLVIYSDGITEAMNEAEIDFGENRLFKVLQGCMDASAAQMIEKILDSVKDFAGANPQADDMTLLVLKRDKS